MRSGKRPEAAAVSFRLSDFRGEVSFDGGSGLADLRDNVVFRPLCFDN